MLCVSPGTVTGLGGLRFAAAVRMMEGMDQNTKVILCVGSAAVMTYLAWYFFSPKKKFGEWMERYGYLTLLALVGLLCFLFAR